MSVGGAGADEYTSTVLLSSKVRIPLQETRICQVWPRGRLFKVRGVF